MEGWGRSGKRGGDSGRRRRRGNRVGTDRAAGQRAGLPSPPSLLQPRSGLGSSGLSTLRPTLDTLAPSPRQAHPPLKQPTDLLSLSLQCRRSGDISWTLRVTELRARTPLCLTSIWQGPSVSLGGTWSPVRAATNTKEQAGVQPPNCSPQHLLLPAPPPTQGSGPLFDGTVSPTRTQTSVFLSV